MKYRELLVVTALFVGSQANAGKCLFNLQYGISAATFGLVPTPKSLDGHRAFDLLVFTRPSKGGTKGGTFADGITPLRRKIKVFSRPGYFRVESYVTGGGRTYSPELLATLQSTFGNALKIEKKSRFGTGQEDDFSFTLSGSDMPFEQFDSLAGSLYDQTVE